MINEKTVEGLIQEMIDWNIGTISKGYDREEEAETIEADTKEFMKAIFDAILQALPEEPTYPNVDEYLAMVKKASEMGKYDEMFENGYRRALTEVKHILNEARNAK